jgi:hypothetical protein
MLEVALPGHGTDPHAPIRDRYLPELGHPMQVHDVARPNKSHRQQWNQALTARQGSGLAPVLGHEPQRLLKHLGRWYSNGGGFKAGPPLVKTLVRCILPQPGHDRNTVAEHLMVIAARVMGEAGSDEVLISDWSPAGWSGVCAHGQQGSHTADHRWPAIRTTGEP